MTEGEHTSTKTGRQRRASYATMCQWIVVSVSSVVRAFMKAGIITEQQPSTGNSNETDSDNDERDPGMLDAEIAQTLKMTHVLFRLMRLIMRCTLCTKIDTFIDIAPYSPKNTVHKLN